MSKFVKVSRITRKTKVEWLVNIDKIIYIELADNYIQFANEGVCVDKDSIEKIAQHLNIIYYNNLKKTYYLQLVRV